MHRFGSPRCDLGKACDVIDLTGNAEELQLQQALLESCSQAKTLSQEHHRDKHHAMITMAHAMQEQEDDEHYAMIAREHAMQVEEEEVQMRIDREISMAMMDSATDQQEVDAKGQEEEIRMAAAKQAMPKDHEKVLQAISSVPSITCLTRMVRSKKLHPGHTNTNAHHRL
eukprot:1299303-Rhodomonas_salina.1